MAITKKQLFDEALHLEEGERATLVGLLLESLETEVEEGVEAAWIAEVERRMTELDSGSVQSIPWENVKDRLLSQIHEE